MTRRMRRGAALALALFALVMMALIADAMLAPSLASRRASWRLAAYHAAESEAERAIGSIAGEWTPARWRALATGAESVTVRQVMVQGIAATGVRVETRIRRLGPSVFWVAASTSARLADAPAASYRSMLVELVRDSVRQPAALTAGGDIALGAEATLAVTNDCATVGEEEPPTLVAVPGATVTRGGIATSEGLRDTTARAAHTYLAPAGIRLASLIDAAAVPLPDGAVITPGPIESGGECVAGPENWGGSPPAACAAYAPAVVGDGDLLVRGGTGQGTLVVHGRLEIEGPFHYRGLIVASGGIETRGGPVTIEGAVFTSAHGNARLHGSTVVTSSVCSLSAAADATSRVIVVPVRGWWR